jgi:hypothetical protein
MLAIALLVFLVGGALVMGYVPGCAKFLLVIAIGVPVMAILGFTAFIFFTSPMFDDMLNPVAAQQRQKQAQDAAIAWEGIRCTAQWQPECCARHTLSNGMIEIHDVCGQARANIKRQDAIDRSRGVGPW